MDLAATSSATALTECPAVEKAREKQKRKIGDAISGLKAEDQLEFLISRLTEAELNGTEQKRELERLRRENGKLNTKLNSAEKLLSKTEVAKSKLEQLCRELSKTHREEKEQNQLRCKQMQNMHSETVESFKKSLSEIQQTVEEKQEHSKRVADVEKLSKHLNQLTSDYETRLTELKKLYEQREADLGVLAKAKDSELDALHTQIGETQKRVQQVFAENVLLKKEQKAKGSILIDLVAAQLELREKDYFGLAYYDDQKLQHWLYPEKRIKKQLKGLPLEFWFQVKFYPPQPAQLSEDLTRYLLYLQLRRDVHTERLPVSFAAQANLGAFVAQAMLGDYRSSEEYADHLNSARIAQPTTEQEQFIGHVREMHKQHRGLTPQEAELNYLNACKALAMYGVHLFPAKDSKGKAVQVGISAHGISLYSEQMRIHRFAWPGIIKFSFRRYHFNVKLKAGEIDSKKEASLTYNLSSYEHAKLLWKCAVEHHGFFRLIQPDRKGKHHFLSFGSARFRYTGRTNIQSQMASQLFETPTVDDHLKSKSVDQIALKGPTEHHSPLNYADEATPQKSKQPQQLNEQQPNMVTSLHYQEQIGAKKDKKKKRMKKKRKHLSGQKSASASSSSSSSSSSDTEAEEIHVLVHDEEHHQQKMPEKITEAANFRTIESMDADGGGTMPLPSHTTTVRTWHEQSTGPQHVTTEVDEHGNMIRRVVTTEHVKHTVQTHSYQTASVDDDGTANAAAAINNNTTANVVAKSPPPVPPARRRGSSTTTMPQAQTDVGGQQEQLAVGKNVTFENGVKQKEDNVSATGGQPSADDVGELVSTKLVTTGNRTIETLTYKKEADGVVETRVEHRITIHANEEIDHDAELDRAISEATKMNPNMKVEKVEVERSSS